MGTILISGGAGFVGAPLATAISDHGDQVVVIDNLRSGKPAPSAPGIEFIRGDIRDRKLVREILEGFRPHVVVHLAALHYIPYCNAHPDETIDVNVAGTQVLLDSCAQLPPRRLFFASTAAVYAPNEDPHRETDPVRPIDIYGLTKAFGELAVRRFHETTGVPVLTGRLFNVYGPGDPNRHVIPEIVDQIGAAPDDPGEVAIELGTMTTKRDYIHVSDVVSAIAALLSMPFEGSEIVNVGSGVTTSVAELVRKVERVLDRTVTVTSDSAERVRKVDRPVLHSDITKLTRLTGWRPATELEAGLKELIRMTSRAS